MWENQKYMDSDVVCCVIHPINMIILLVSMHNKHRKAQSMTMTGHLLYTHHRLYIYASGNIDMSTFDSSKQAINNRLLT